MLSLLQGFLQDIPGLIRFRINSQNFSCVDNGVDKVSCLGLLQCSGQVFLQTLFFAGLDIEVNSEEVISFQFIGTNFQFVGIGFQFIGIGLFMLS